MTCYSPMHCFDGGVKENGKMDILFKAPAGTKEVALPCGRCIGCQLERSRQWAARCMCEAAEHVDNCFVTLTFDNTKLPASFDGNLDVTLHQDFMKRLRKHFDAKVRFFMAGEYGKDLGRPHFHYILYGVDFNDKVLQTVRNGNRLYSSATLGKLWPYGFNSIGDVSFKSASYVAQYCLKKSVGNLEYSKEGKTRMQCNKHTGEIKVAEFVCMSRRPGIGKAWFDKFSRDVYPSDEFVVNGRITRPPRFFDKLLDSTDSDLLEAIKQKRMERIRFSSDLRLLDKEEVKLASIRTLVRPLED